VTYYQVNATINFAAWVEVEADSPESAADEAREMSASAFEYDLSSAEIEFNVTPEVERVQ